MEIRRRGLGIADGMTQVKQRLTQIAAGNLFGTIGPEHADKRLATMRPIRFRRQVRQQCANLVGLKGCDSGSIQADPKRTEQAQR